MQTAANESRFKLNHSVESGTHDLISALKGEEGTFEVSYGEQNFLIKCNNQQDHHSITSLIPSEASSGSRSSPGWIITRREGEHQSHSAKA